MACSCIPNSVSGKLDWKSKPVLDVTEDSNLSDETQKPTPTLILEEHLHQDRLGILATTKLENTAKPHILVFCIHTTYPSLCGELSVNQMIDRQI